MGQLGTDVIMVRDRHLGTVIKVIYELSFDTMSLTTDYV